MPSSKVRSFSSLNAQPENLRSTPSIHSVGQIKPQAIYHTLKKTDKLHHRIAEWQKSAGVLNSPHWPFQLLNWEEGIASHLDSYIGNFPKHRKGVQMLSSSKRERKKKEIIIHCKNQEERHFKQKE